MQIGAPPSRWRLRTLNAPDAVAVSGVATPAPMVAPGAGAVIAIDGGATGAGSCAPAAAGSGTSRALAAASAARRAAAGRDTSARFVGAPGMPLERLRANAPAHRRTARWVVRGDGPRTSHGPAPRRPRRGPRREPAGGRPRRGAAGPRRRRDRRPEPVHV